MLPTSCLCTQLRRASRGVTRRYDDALAAVGLGAAQFSLLRHVQRLGQPSISLLADAMGLDRSTLGRNLRVLEEQGLVQLGEGRDLRAREYGSQKPACNASNRRCHYGNRCSVNSMPG